MIVPKNRVVPLNFAAIMLVVSSLSLVACGLNPLLFSFGVVCLAHELVLDSKNSFVIWRTNLFVIIWGWNTRILLSFRDLSIAFHFKCNDVCPTTSFFRGLRGGGEKEN